MKIDQTTILNWFNVEDPNYKSIDSLKSLISGVWEGMQSGLGITDINNVIFFLAFVRFIILIFRYNIKTSTYITCIGIVTSWLWYRHLVDIIQMYSQMLIKIPYLQKLATVGRVVRNVGKTVKKSSGEVVLGSGIPWTAPGQLVSYAATNAMIRTTEDGVSYYIDPISMIVSNLNETDKARILPYYYGIYNFVIPRICEGFGQFWSEGSSIASYAIITRMGKRYCPYLIRWHWTFLLLIAFFEQILLFFLSRVVYFQRAVIQPNILVNETTRIVKRRIFTTGSADPNLLFQFNFLNFVIVFFVVLHLGFLFLALLHALYGQYFYVPFLTENTELHVGPRPRNSIYSGGLTAWQDEKQVGKDFKVPKVWYGWFGSGTQENWITGPVKQFLLNNIAKLTRLFKK